MAALYYKRLKANINILLMSIRFAFPIRCEITKCYPTLPRLSKTFVVDNSMWGMHEVFEFAKESDVLIEHGWFWGDTLLVYHEHPKIKKIFTFTNYRERFLKSVYPEKSIMNLSSRIKELSQLRNGITCAAMRKYSNCAVYFPDKSSSVEVYSHDVKHIGNIISKLKSLGFIDVIVPIFYLDFNKQLKTEVENLGGTPVCFGHRYDSQFLPRLMSVLSFSRLVVVDRPGTNLLYAQSLRIPVLITRNEFVRGDVNTSYQRNIDEQKMKQIDIMIKALPKLGDHCSELALSNEELMQVKSEFGWDADMNRKLIFENKIQ